MTDLVDTTPKGDPVSMTIPANLITLKQAAELVRVHSRTLRRYIDEGRVPGYQIGPRNIWVDPADLNQLVRPIPAAKSR